MMNKKYLVIRAQQKISQL